MKKCLAWILVLAMLLSLCGVVIAAEDGAPTAQDVVIEPQDTSPVTPAEGGTPTEPGGTTGTGESGETGGETPTPPVHTDHPVCGDPKCSDGHTEETWTAWNGTDALPTGTEYVYLDSEATEIALSSAITIDKTTLNICLNGHTLSRSAGRPIVVKNGGTLNICDCSGGNGAIVGKAVTTARGGLIDITGKTSAVNLYHVALKNGKAVKDTSGKNGNGGAIYVAAGSLNIVGGSIEGCEAAANGGAIYLAAGTSLTLDGVHISKCKGSNGSAVYIVNKADCTIKGALIETGEASGNGAVYVEQGAKLTLSGAPVIQGNARGNVYLPAGVTFTLANDFSAAAKVGVGVAGVDSKTETQTAFASFANDISKCFTADADGVVTAYVAPAEGEIEGQLVLEKYRHIHAICGKSLEDCDDSTHEFGTNSEWTANASDTTIPAEGNIYLTTNVELAGTLTITKTLNLCLNGYTIKSASGRVFDINGGTLNLCNCEESGKIGAIMDSGNATDVGGAFWLRGGGTLNMFGGRVEDCTGKNGGALYLTSGKALLDGVTITGCTAATVGSAIYVQGSNKPTCTLKDCEISSNQTTNSGTVYVQSGAVFKLVGAVKITGNKKDGAEINLVLAKNARIDATELGAKAQIGITAADATPVEFGTASEDVSGCFTSDVKGKVIRYETGKLILDEYKHVHPVCGDADACDDSHADQTWTSWDGKAVETGKEHYLYLADDVAISGTLTIGAGTTLHLCLNGKTLKNTAGRVFTVKNGGTLTICDCSENQTTGTLTSSGSSARGGLIDVTKDSGAAESGTFVLYGGRLTGGKAKKDASGANGYGGAVSVTGGSTFEMRGGVIENCSAEFNGGAISARGGTLVLAGGTIRGNTTESLGGGVYTEIPVTVSGNINIVGNMRGAKDSNLYLANKTSTVTIDSLESGASIGVLTQGGDGTVIAPIADESDLAYFESDDRDVRVAYKDGALVLEDARVFAEHKHPICGDAGCAAHGDELIWQPSRAKSSIPASGTYFLTQNVTLSSAVTVDGGTLTLCLNGYTVSRKGGRPFAVTNGGTLNICDCKGTGTIKGVAKTTTRGGLIDVSGGSTLRLYGGTLTGGYAKKNDNDKKNTTGHGGAIAIMGKSTFEMYGGEITGNTAKGNGGGLYLSSDCTAILDGGSIHHNTALGYGGGVFAAVAAEVDEGDTDVYDNEDCGGPDSPTADLYITGPRGGAELKIPEASGNHKHTLCGEAGCTEHGEEIIWTEWTNSGILPAEGSFCLETDVDLGKGISVKIGKTLNICLNGHSITRSGGRIFTVSGGTLNICDCQGGGQVIGASKKTLRGGIVDVRKPSGAKVGGTFNLYSGTLTGGLAVKDGKGNNGNGGAVYIGAGTFRMYGGEISGCAARNNGGAVVVSGNSAMLLAGGVIKDCSATRAGGILVQAGAKLEMTGGSVLNHRANTGAGLYVNNAEANITGGVIADNIAKEYGGGIRAAGSTVTLSGVTLRADKAAKEGGGIYTSGETKLTIDGAVFESCRAEIVGGAIRADASTTKLLSGELRNNSAAKNGGAIYASAGTMELAGGTISGSTAKENGGGLFAKETDVTVSGTNFTGNKAGANGGAILANMADLTITGGTISGNKAVLAAGVLGESGSKIHIQGGTVSGNTASKNGGGVFAYGADIAMSGGVITGNRANKGNGGGLRVDKGSAVLSGGEIRENSASNNGGGVYVGPNAVFTMTGAAVQNNNAENAGAGMFADSATLYLQGGTIAENDAVGDGGGLRADNCTISIDGVTIRANTTQGNGGGVCAGKKSKITMRAGLITENTSVVAAGGMVAQGVGTTLEMTGGAITKNVAETSGGGLYCSKVDFKMTGGEIAGNTASQAGGVFITTRMEMSGGAVRDNVAKTDGGGVRNAWGTTVELTGGAITGNTAQRYGGGVYCMGSFLQSGGEVSGNSTSTGGGAVATRSGASVELAGGVMNGNSAANGGAVYIAPESACTITDGTLSGNTAAKNGGAVYAYGSLALLGGSLTGNSAESAGGDVYLDASAGDGQSYLPGVFTLGGAPQVDELHLTLGAGVAIVGALEKDAKLGVTLEGGTLTQTVRGAYDYDKAAEGVYTLAAGDRSVTDPEPPVAIDRTAAADGETNADETASAAQPATDGETAQPSVQSDNTGLIIGTAAAVAVLAAAAVIVLRQRAKRGRKESV